jgi:hypothetical protein
MKNFYQVYKFAKGFGVLMFAFLFVACSQLDLEPNNPGDNLRVLALEGSNGGPIGELLSSDRYEVSGGGNVECGDIKDEEGEFIEFGSSTGRINADDEDFYAKFEEKGFRITVTDGKYVSWEYIGDLCLAEVAVIVKGSNDANVYYYSGEDITGDSGLAAPIAGGSGSPADLSNLTICYTEVPCDDQCFEFEGDTAWGADGNAPGGLRYTARGNWATYTAYEGSAKTVSLFAGQTKLAGTVSFSVPVDGEVTITIDLADGWDFEEEDENVAIQDYNAAPSGNPAPGLFDHKGNATGDSFSIVVPENTFYGVHVNVGRWVEVECEEEE